MCWVFFAIQSSKCNLTPKVRYHCRCHTFVPINRTEIILDHEMNCTIINFIRNLFGIWKKSMRCSITGEIWDDLTPLCSSCRWIPSSVQIYPHNLLLIYLSQLFIFLFICSNISYATIYLPVHLLSIFCAKSFKPTN